MKTLLIVYHSMTGGTLQMARAAATGASDEGLRVSLLPAAQARADDLLEAEGYIFATPENLAGMSGMMKDFFDRTYYAALEQINGRPFLALICAGSDGRNAALQIERIATGWRLKQIAEPYIVLTNAQTKEQILKPKTIDAAPLQRCEALGKTLASGIAMGIF